MKRPGNKKLGYKQYASLLAQAHQKLELLAEKFHELQTYFIAYVEYCGHNIEFNDWMNKRIKEMETQIQQEKESKEQVSEEV